MEPEPLEEKGKGYSSSLSDAMDWSEQKRMKEDDESEEESDENGEEMIEN